MLAIMNIGKYSKAGINPSLNATYNVIKSNLAPVSLTNFFVKDENTFLAYGDKYIVITKDKFESFQNIELDYKIAFVKFSKAHGRYFAFFTEDSTGNDCKYATSLDGISWTYGVVEVGESGSVNVPVLFKDSSNDLFVSFVKMKSGGGTVTKTLYEYKFDGSNFINKTERYNASLTQNGAVYPYVVIACDGFSIVEWGTSSNIKRFIVSNSYSVSESPSYEYHAFDGVGFYAEMSGATSANNHTIHKTTDGITDSIFTYRDTSKSSVETYGWLTKGSNVYLFNEYGNLSMSGSLNGAFESMYTQSGNVSSITGIKNAHVFDDEQYMVLISNDNTIYYCEIL